MPKTKITKTFVDKTPFTDKGQKLYCDTEIKGFYLIVGMKSKTYVAQKDINGKTVRYTIGKHGHFTPEKARSIAKDKLCLMAQGVNPNKEEEKEIGETMTLGDILESYRSTRKSVSERTIRDYNYYLEKYLSDWINVLIVDITKEMVVKKHSFIGTNNGHRVANGTMQILRALFNHANALFDICETNPVSHLSRIKAWYPEKRRRTYIKPSDLKKWWEGVQDLENDTMRDFFTLLIFTGLRRGEASSLRWGDLNLEDKTLTINQTKNGDPLTLPLGEFLLKMFETRKRKYHNYEFVFPGSGKTGCIAEPKKGVYRVIAQTGVQFTCHDLRRTFITIAESLEISAYALKRLINHRVTDITGSYIIVDVDRLREPVRRIEKFLLEKING